MQTTTDKRRGDATGEMSVMGASGDKKHYWNKKSWKEVEKAKQTFDDFRAKGYKAYRMNKKGDQGEPMDEFDPSAGEVLLVPAMAGG